MKELDLRSFFVVLLQNLRLIIAVAAAMAVVFGVATNLLTEDTYSSRCSMYVMNITKDSDNNLSGISTSGLEASQRMVNEYIILLRSDNVLNEVSRRVNAQGFNTTAASIRGMIELTAVEETALLRIITTASDPMLAKLVCEELMNCAPQKISAFMNELGSITPVDEAEMGYKNPPKTTRNAVLGAVFGILVVCGLLFIRCLMDNTIKDEKDLKTRFNVNVLGVVMDTTGTVDKAALSAAKKTGGKR